MLAASAPAATLSPSTLGTALQSGDFSTSNTAAKAVDGATGSFSATLNVSNSYWEVELRRAHTLTRIELVAPAATNHINVTSGLILRVQDLRDATAFSTTVTNPGAGGTWGVNLPAGTRGRIVRFGLENGQTNGAGTRQVILGEVRLYGDPAPDFSPVQPGSSGVATQSTSFSSSYGAAYAVDGNPTTCSMTTNLPDSFWLLTLDYARPLHRVELINRHDTAAARMQGLTLRVLDDLTNTVASAPVTDPGLGGTWGYTLPAGITGRFIRVGLEGGATNGFGDQIVQLAEVNILTASNLALGRDAYMVRLQDTLPPATNVNDGNYATESATTIRTVDGYWEIDLGQTFALSSVRAVCGNGFAARVAHCTVRLFDEEHESVFAQHLSANSTGTFDTDVNGPRMARYVRVGLENKERTAGGIEWYLDFKEIMAFGQPASAVGLLAFEASVSNVAGGGSATLAWLQQGQHRLDLFPAGGSAGADTSPGSIGTRMVSPATSVEYVLVGTNGNGSTARAVSVLVNGAPLPLRIGEFVTDNVLSAKDGRGKAEDWIEIHNPNNADINLGGFGLSDDPLAPMKWVFPATNLAAHGHLLVFASGRDESVDEGGCLHASFQLDSGGESVVLTGTNGLTTVDAILNYPPQMEDLAYGRTLAGSTTFLDPTPGAWNLAASYNGWLHPPVFSQTRGFFTNAFSLSIVHSNAGASLFYSINGPAPATVFIGALNVASTACVRAEVRRTGYKSPRVKTHTYVFREQVITAPYMRTAITLDTRYTNRVRQGLRDLPVISVAVPVVPDDYVERAASMELFMPDGSEFQAHCGFQRFGGAWAADQYAKKSYRLQFRSEYGDDKLRAPLFLGFERGFQTVDAFDSLDLMSGSQDMYERGFYMAGRFVEDAMLDMGSLNPHGRFVNVFINGTYWGQYNARERLVDVFLADYLGGDTTNYVTVRGNDNVSSPFVPGTPEPPRRYPWDRVRALRNSYQQVKPYLDVPHLTDFMLLWWYGNCENEYRAAGSVEAGSGFKFWIADADGFLNAAAVTANNTANAGPGDLFGGLVGEGNTDFKTLVTDRIQRHFFREGALTPGQSLARLDARMAEITNSLVTECARWGYRTPDTWQSAADTIRTGLFPQRTTNLFTYLRNRGLYPAIDPPQLNQYGGSVTNGFLATMAAAAGTIYYTLDGSDPRLPGGGLAPGALSTNSASQTPIAQGATWRYWDQGSLPATNWNSLSYDDTAWPTGRTEFGYGDGGEATTNSYGPNANNKHISYYYRKPFLLANATATTQLLVNLMRDDGAVVYLNGQELLRSNLPTGIIAYSTLAVSNQPNPMETNYYLFPIAPTNLVSGTNVLAVEIHQVAANNPDMSFNLSLEASGPMAPLSLAVLSNTLVSMRVLVGTNWSALITTEFLIAQLRPPAGGDVVISEIHYNPDGSDDYQFIELYNAGTNLANLGGARLGGGVDFLFPNGRYLAPGKCLVVVEDPEAFSNRHRTASSPWYYPGIEVAGTWSGKLASSGEEISLLFSNSLDLFTVSYRTDGSWPARASGRGSSLELRSPASVPADAPARATLAAQGTTWRSSSLYHGSPGRLDDYVRPVEISESLSHTDADTDWVELHNPGPAPADISGLYLGDSYATPLQHRLTNGTVIAPGGFLILPDTQLGFGFSELGSDILLVQASGTNLIRFVDTVDIGAMEREETAGRYVRSDGAVDFTELRAASKGATNALPRVGPVVMSEVMYRPLTGMAEYVEFTSLCSSNLMLNDPAHPANCWSLSGAIEYAFPSGTLLPPCTPIIVCGTNPAAFRAQYGVHPAIPVYGPWTGALDNAGETIKLLRPGLPELDGFVPQYRVDRVSYGPVAPWPASADAGGISLERVTLEGYGNDPGTWQASGAGGSPGAVAGNRLPAIGVTGDLVIDEGAALQLLAQATDADAPWQSCSIVSASLPTGSTFNATNGVFTWTPGEADGPGSHTLLFVASDNAICGNGVRTQAVVVDVREVNQPPVLPQLSDLHFPAETFIQRLLAASDPDLPAQYLTFAQSGLPSGVELNPGTGWLEGETAAPGAYGVSVAVTDDQVPPLTATGSFTVIVSEPFVFRSELSDDAGQRISFQTLSNATYEVHFTDRLAPPDWQLLERVEHAPGGPLEVIDPDGLSSTQRFYRVIWVDVGG